MRSVGVMGDERTYDYTVALRAVTTTDFMTGEWARIPYDVLDTVSRRIVNEVKHVNRIVYDITGKPPATIEWEGGICQRTKQNSQETKQQNLEEEIL